MPQIRRRLSWCSETLTRNKYELNMKFASLALLFFIAVAVHAVPADSGVSEDEQQYSKDYPGVEGSSFK